jgi:hypothetical protein
VSFIYNYLVAQTQLLVKTWINLNAKNLENKTALDIATTSEIKKLLSTSRAKSGSQVSDTHTRAHRLRSKASIVDKVGTSMRRIRRDILDEQRNTWLIVVTLVVTSTFQAALSPPVEFIRLMLVTIIMRASFPPILLFLPRKMLGNRSCQNSIS